MIKLSIKTEKGEFNRWIRRTNAFIRDLRKNLAALPDAIKEIKAELDTPQSELVIIPLQRYFDICSCTGQVQRTSSVGCDDQLQLYRHTPRQFTL